ncbi:hypothetical protein Taro_018671 [Colocasia esculenta]|uniref:Uncharacterized protein n=1 Tax=Colocasia esculenta TaxID=4460 RepID=A0A843UJ95_COLES|nr:hypothetical protein [Colocasia esculenta]
MQGLVQAMQSQAHTQAALQAQLEAQERADVWWASLLHTRFEDGAIDVAWDELVAFNHRTLDEALSTACRQEGEMEQYLEEKKASQKRPAATFQRHDKKKAVYQTQQRSVAVGSTQMKDYDAMLGLDWLEVFWPKATLASTSGRRGGVNVQTGTPILTQAFGDVDVNLSDLHAQQSCCLLKQGMATHWGMFPNGSKAV